MPGNLSGSSDPKFGTATEAHNVKFALNEVAKRFTAIIGLWKPVLEFVQETSASFSEVCFASVKRI